LFGRITSNVDQEKIQQPIIIEIKEYGGGGMSHIIQARPLGDVVEAAATEVLEQVIAVADGRDEQVGIAVIVDIGERRRHRDLVGQPDTGLDGDVFEFPFAQIAPQLVRAQLGGEVNIEQSITVDVSDSQAVTMVIVRSFVRFARIIDDLVFEAYLALDNAVGELKLMEHLHRLCGQDLLLAAFVEQPQGEIVYRLGFGGADPALTQAQQSQKQETIARACQVGVGIFRHGEGPCHVVNSSPPRAPQQD
jgi:hypothetical protein